MTGTTNSESEYLMPALNFEIASFPRDEPLKKSQQDIVYMYKVSING